MHLFVRSTKSSSLKFSSLFSVPPFRSFLVYWLSETVDDISMEWCMLFFCGIFYSYFAWFLCMFLFVLPKLTHFDGQIFLRLRKGFYVASKHFFVVSVYLFVSIVFIIIVFFFGPVFPLISPFMGTGIRVIPYSCYNIFC